MTDTAIRIQNLGKRYEIGELVRLHGDGNTRQCMATAVTAYKQSFGFDAPPYTYADFEESDCIINYPLLPLTPLIPAHRLRHRHS